MLFTVGHGTLDGQAFVDLLRGAGVELVVDVRRFPGSRRNRQFGRDVLAATLHDAGIAYRWEERLGGRRKGVPESRNTALRNDSFRAYADHMGTPAFADAISEVLDESSRFRTAVMCSESVWWRCHRRLVADFVVLAREGDVRHLMHDGALRPHAVTSGARAEAEGVVYDGGVVPLPVDDADDPAR